MTSEEDIMRNELAHQLLLDLKDDLSAVLLDDSVQERPLLKVVVGRFIDETSRIIDAIELDDTLENDKEFYKGRAEDLQLQVDDLEEEVARLRQAAQMLPPLNPSDEPPPDPADPPADGPPVDDDIPF